MRSKKSDEQDHQDVDSDELDYHHYHHHGEDFDARHDHHSEEDHSMEKRLSGKFSGIEKMKKYKSFDNMEEKEYLFNLF